MEETMDPTPTKRNQNKSKNKPRNKTEKPLSWVTLNLFSTCKDCKEQDVKNNNKNKIKRNNKKSKRVGSSGRLSSCNISSRSLKAPDETNNGAISATSSFNSVTTNSNSLSPSSSSSLSSSSFSSLGGSFRATQLKKLSVCYECNAVVSRDPSLRATLCSCNECGEIFTKSERLELHNATRHAVSELGPEDSSRNIVEIIFQSSWLKKESPVCKIERILKVNNTHNTISKFEEFRESIKSKSTNQAKKYPRCVADGNELLRFYCASFACSLGFDGTTHLCQSVHSKCNVCTIIRDGFRVDGDGKISTFSTSGQADDVAWVPQDSEKKAMLVCRVIAGRVRRGADETTEECDSVSCSDDGNYLDELSLFNPKAILPCFVVIYSGY